MNSRTVHVSRTVSTASGMCLTENASADLPDDLTLDAVTEAGRRALLAELLFRSLPSVQAKHKSQPCQPPPPPFPPRHSTN